MLILEIVIWKTPAGRAGTAYYIGALELTLGVQWKGRRAKTGDSVSEWRDMSTCRLLFQSITLLKIPRK
jgi:hypothetical protein